MAEPPDVTKMSFEDALAELEQIGRGPLWTRPFFSVLRGMKQRADQMLVTRGLVESRARAQALIMAGKVFSGDRTVAKAGDLLPEDAALMVRGQDHPWVSRGGLK